MFVERLNVIRDNALSVNCSDIHDISMNHGSSYTHLLLFCKKMLFIFYPSCGIKLSLA